MDSSFFNSFDNIDLNETRNKDDDEIGDPAIEILPEVENEKTSEDDQLDQQPQVINRELDMICKKMFSDYSKYFSVNTTSQVSELDECIENLLTHMEEFYGLVESIRNDNGQCVDHLLDTFNDKWKTCQRLFAKIDNLEKTIERVGSRVNEMEVQVIKAEEMMGKRTSATTVKRLFGLIHFGLRP